MPVVPRIEGPSVESRNLPSARLEARASQVPFERLATAVEGIGDQFARIDYRNQQRANEIAEREKRKADQAGVLSGRRKLNEFVAQAWSPNNAQGIRAFRGKDALGVPEKFMPEFDKHVAEIRKNLGNDDQRLAFDSVVEQDREQFYGRIEPYMVHENEKFQTAEFDAYWNNSQEAASQAAREGNGAAFQRERDLAEAALTEFATSRGLPDEIVTQKKADWASAVHGSAIGAMLADGNLKSSLAYYKEHEADMNEDARTRARHAIRVEQNRVEAEAKQNRAIARAEFGERVQNAASMALALGRAPNAPSRDEFLRMYGHEEGARRYDDFEVIQRLGVDQQQIRGMSQQEQSQLLADTKPTEGTPNFKAEQEAWEQRARLVEKARTEYDRDPAEYVLANSNPVRAAYSSMQRAAADPAASLAAKQIESAAFLTAMRAEQERIGGVKNLLPKAYVDHVSSLYGKLSDEKPADAARVVKSLADQWGKNWSVVYPELAAKMPGTPVVIGAGMRPAPAALLAEASRMKREDLTVGLPSGATKEIKESIAAALDPFRASVAPLAGGGRTYATFHEQAETLALAYARQGLSPVEAAARAADAVVNERYAFTDTYRIPRERNVDAVEAGARRELAKVDTSQLLLQPEPGMTEQQVAESFVPRLRQQGRWVTAPDESGLVLYGPDGSFLPRKDGTPYIKRWDELEDAGRDPDLGLHAPIPRGKLGLD